MSKIQKIFASVCFAIVVAIGVSLAGYWYYLVSFAGSSGPNTASIELEIAPGSNAKQIAHLLESKGVISSSKTFYDYLRFITQNGDQLQAGDYEFAAGQTPEQIVDILRRGRTKEIRFTIPEGANKREIAEIIEKAGFGKKEEILAQMEDPILIEEFGIPKIGAGGQKGGVAGGIEGYLFPDTYQFPKRATPLTILRRMRTRLDQVFTQDMTQRLQDAHLSFHELITLASIVEKETGDPFERPEIASVFFNRLETGMKLQTDPTVIYAIKDYAGNLTRAHLKIDNAYNTYVYEGLPPGPIASPGLEAIKSVLWPHSGKNLYFVSRNDGTHVFCPSLKCHQNAVKIWQIDYFRQKKSAATAAATTRS